MAYEEKYMLRAIELAKACAEQDEVPVGAVVVKSGSIIAESGNRKERDSDATHHAEMLALSSATEKENNWWLEDCDVYVTLEPCSMCGGGNDKLAHPRAVFRSVRREDGGVRLESQSV